MKTTIPHTPGPWEVITREKRGHHAAHSIRQAAPRHEHYPEYHLRIAELHAHRLWSADNVPGDKPNDLSNWETEGCQAANARLIASAPELLEALVRLREWIRNPGEDDGPENEMVILQADAAIAKATA